jgi:hypothetical protein
MLHTSDRPVRSERPTAAALAAATPEARDRYVDFLRLASIFVVVLGHWLMAVVTVRDGAFHIGNVLGMVPLLWLATWALQVMPVFFFVGGKAAYVTIDSHRRQGLGATEFLVSRAQRLMRPVAVLFAVWLPLSLLLDTFGVDGRILADATRVVCQPLWFVGVFLMVTALAPAMRELHDAYRGRVLVGLALAAIAVDVVRFDAIGAVGWCNVLFVWLFAQQLGFFYADGSLAALRRPQLWQLALGGVLALVTLTSFGPYPSSMVGLPGEKLSNMAPPTVCLLALTILQVALVMLCRDVANRWLQKPAVWTGVVGGNGVIMTIFLWHLSAMLLFVTIAYPLGFPQPAGGTALWWATRALWIAGGLVPLVGVVALLGRYERPRTARFRARGASSTWVAAAGIALLAIGVSGIATGNLSDIWHGTSRLVVVDVTPVESLTAAALGYLLLRASVAVHRPAGG